jgi:hypothetical protein
MLKTTKLAIALAVGSALLQGCQPPAAPTAEVAAKATAEPEAPSAAEPVSTTAPAQPAASSAGLNLLLTSKTPYQPQQDWRSYSAVPAGYQPVSIQHVARHGSRYLSDKSDDVLLLQLIEKARAQQALTPLGERLAVLAQQLHQAHQPSQYGEISKSGVAEHQGMAQRLVARFPALFATAAFRQQRLAVLHSGRERANQSGDAFVAELLKLQPALTPFVDAAKADAANLYFNKAEGSEGYQRYEEEDPRLQAVMAAIQARPALQQQANAMLARLFSAEFIAELAQGRIKLTVPDEDDQISNVLEAAQVIYSLYSIASNLAVEGPFDFTELLLPEHLTALAELDDAESFYGRGPGFTGEDITYQLAGRLVGDMLAKAEQPNGYLATLRFSHAQALIPLAAYLGIPGASESLAEQDAYSYQNSQWRTALVSPMAANVQWEIYQNAEQIKLVRMLHNEKEAQFKAQCQPYGDTRYFYLLSELQRCLLPVQPALVDPAPVASAVSQ